MSSQGKVPERSAMQSRREAGRRAREGTRRFFSSPQRSTDQNPHVRKAFGVGERTMRKKQNKLWSTHRARSSWCFHQLE